MGTIEIVIVVYGLIFTVMLFLSIKQWRWFHIFMMLLLLGANVVLFSFAGRVLEVRHEWTKKYEDNIAVRAKAEEDLQLLLNGKKPDGSIVNYTNIAESLIAIRHEYQRILMGRGRVWRSVNLTNMQLTANIVGSTAVVTMADDQHGIEAGSRFLLFFEEVLPAADGQAQAQNVPAVYFGEYNVEVANGAAITLKNVFAPTIFNRQVMVAGVPISMYQKMPTDAHAPFAVKPENKSTQQAVPFEASPNPMFGTMDPAHIDHIFETVINPLSVELQQYDLSAMRERFKADGSPLKDGHEANPRNIWYKIQFIQDHTLAQKVNGDAPQAKEETFGDFSAGEAVVPMLYHFLPSKVTYYPKTGSKETGDLKGAYTTLALGEKADSIEFRQNEIIFMSGAEKLKVNDGDEGSPVYVPVFAELLERKGGAVAKELGKYYVRPVHNYTDIFRSYPIQMASLKYTDDNALQSILRITASRNDAATQSLFRKKEKKRLEFDLELYRRDEAEAGEYVELLEKEVVNLTAELAAIFQRNQVFAEQLAKDQAALEAEINVKAAAAAAAAANSE